MHKKTFLTLALITISIIIPAQYESLAANSQPIDPLPPEAGIVADTLQPAATSTEPEEEARVPVPAAPQAPATPAAEKPLDGAMRLVIPSISLNSPVTPVGVNEKGEMAVPSGTSNYVGWYKYGTRPGDEGSAVMDAHVFAAFSGLSQLRVGSDIYVKEGDATLHFVVRSTQTYLLSAMDLPVVKSIFNQTGGRYLNLITCAGTLTPDHSTYDHRLVIRAELVQ